MKKIITVFALIASLMTIGSTDVYEFKTTITYPAIGKTAFIRSSTPVTGTLTIQNSDETNTTAVLTLTLKKLKKTYTFVPEDASEIAIFGKNGTDCAQMIKFVNEDQTEGLIELTFYGWGTIKTKTVNECTMCGGISSSCTRFTALEGVVGGKYICPCGGTFQAWDGSCFIDPDQDVQDMTVYGTKKATFKLKSVNGKKW